MATSTSITGVLQSVHKHRGDSWSFHVIGKLLNDEQIKRINIPPLLNHVVAKFLKLILGHI